MGRRWGLLGVVIGAAIGAALLGWVVGRQVQSPDEVATQREAPEPSLIAVPVELRVLNSNVVVRGDIRFSESTDLALDPGITAGVDAVVTGRLPQEGDELTEGDVIIEVSTRPVIALQGELPMFRTLAPGSVGDDVHQLEEALSRLGHDPGSVDGLFDGATEDAIVDLYRDLGYTPPGLEDDEADQLQGAEDAVDSAQVMLRDAEATLAASAGAGPSQSLRLSIDASVNSAARSLEDARIEAESLIDIATAAVTAATAARDDAAAAHELATTRLHEAEAGTHPDTGLPPTPEELDILIEEANAASATLDDAVLALGAADDGLARAERDGQTMVGDAEVQLAIARASRAEALAAPDTTFERRAVDDARRALERASLELTELDAALGTRMPKSELVFLELTPRRVDQVLVDLGDAVSGQTVLRISGADIVIDASVSAADRPLLSVGDRVIIDDEALGLELEGQITELSDREVVGAGYAMQIVPVGGDPLALRGLNVRLTIPIESTAGEVLAVPLAALSAGPDGSARVQVEQADGSTQLVIVTVGLSAQGYAEVTPVDGSLAAGDQVVVGRG